MPAPGYDAVDLSWPWGISDIIDGINPDYIHIATEGPIGLATRMLCDRRQWRYNTSYHTNFAEALKKLLCIPESWSWRYIKWFHRHSGRVLTTTSAMVDILQYQGIHGDIIPWTRGVDRNIFTPELRGLLREPEITLLYVGRVSKEKNLKAFCDLQYPNSQKIVVGDGPLLLTLREQYPEIKFRGFLVGRELAQEYANADVFVFPSHWDTFGLVMIEAMACGTPVAAFPVTGPNQVVESGVTGHLDQNLYLAIDQCLQLDRKLVHQASFRWDWQIAWDIFKKNLIEKIKS
jgi:glycosyltransferase involved in cell wall biosynthesis